MKKYLLGLLLSLPVAASASVCDSSTVNIVNNTASNFKILETEPDNNTSILFLRTGLTVQARTAMNGFAYSGKGSWGDARGNITLQSENDPRVLVKIRYSCTSVGIFDLSYHSTHVLENPTNLRVTHNAHHHNMRFTLDD